MKYEYKFHHCTETWTKSAVEKVEEALNDPKTFEGGWEFVQVVGLHSILLRRSAC